MLRRNGRSLEKTFSANGRHVFATGREGPGGAPPSVAGHAICAVQHDRVGRIGEKPLVDKPDSRDE
jgi:hypothetical protein